MNSGLAEEDYEALAKYRQQRAHETMAEIPYLQYPICLRAVKIFLRFTLGKDVSTSYGWMTLSLGIGLLNKLVKPCCVSGHRLAV